MSYPAHKSAYDDSDRTFINTVRKKLLKMLPFVQIEIKLS